MTSRRGWHLRPRHGGNVLAGLVLVKVLMIAAGVALLREVQVHVGIGAAVLVLHVAVVVAVGMYLRKRARRKRGSPAQVGAPKERRDR